MTAISCNFCARDERIVGEYCESSSEANDRGNILVAEGIVANDILHGVKQ